MLDTNAKGPPFRKDKVFFPSPPPPHLFSYERAFRRLTIEKVIKYVETSTLPKGIQQLRHF